MGKEEGEKKAKEIEMPKRGKKTWEGLKQQA